jgi:hypothetical protein
MTRPAREERPPVPWHLKLVGLALAVYLSFRFFELIEWVFNR